jgi:hypothetical protein
MIIGGGSIHPAKETEMNQAPVTDVRLGGCCPVASGPLASRLIRFNPDPCGSGEAATLKFRFKPRVVTPPAYWLARGLQTENRVALDQSVVSA